MITAIEGIPHYPVDAVEFEGRLPHRNSKLSEALTCLKQTKTQFRYYEIGQRSFLESRDFEKVLKSIESGQHSPYYEDFTQASTIIPRQTWFVEPTPHPRLGIDPTKPRVKTSQRAIDRAKEEYADVRLDGEVEANFLYNIVTGSELAPFCTTTLPIAVVPIEPRNGAYHLITSEEAQRRGFSGLKNWLINAEEVWKTKRSEKADKMNIYQRLDYSRGLTKQSSKAKYKVLYNTSGTYLVSCMLKNEPNEVKVDSSHLKLQGVIADHTTYWFDTDSKDEGQFLTALFNAPIVDALIKPMQARGLFGERHIHKKVLELPLPRFNPRNAKHMKLVQLSEKAQAKALKIIGDLEKNYTSIGKIRSLVKVEISEEALQIDKIVRELIIQAGSLRNTIDHYVDK